MRRYEDMRDSGVDWLGEVPGHWDVVPLKRGADLVTERATTRTNPIALENIEGWTGRLIETNGEFAGDGITFERGDILFGKLRPYLAKVHAAAFEGEAVGDFHVIRPDPLKLNTCFAQYALLTKSVIDLIDGSTHGAKMPRASWETVGGLNLPLPPLHEQRAIAAFLDRETGRIDALLAEQRRLIALLAEKRRATISHAVTRGLDPNAPLKPSGIDWLGDVPAHWGVARLKDAVTFVTSGSRGWAEHYSDEGSIFLRITNLNRGTLALDLSDIQHVDVPDGTEGARTATRAGDLLFSITAYLGSVGVVPEGLSNAYVSQHIALARLADVRVDPRWIGYVTLSYTGQTYLGLRAYGGTKTQLALDDVRELTIPLPRLDEQRRIVAFLDANERRINDLTDTANRAIALLLERRAALISAAVTGKIDVGGEVGDLAA